jgi:hypothetical protein
MATTMKPSESDLEGGSRSVLHKRRFLTCRECGWVHYLMTTEEKAANDRLLERYQLSATEQHLYESGFRQCLRCESLASAFAAAQERDLARAAGHIVTPMFVDGEVGTNYD